MKITFKETLSQHEWIHKELMLSLNSEIIQKAQEDQFYDVKLVVNGIEIEPKHYNHLINNIDKYIKQEAEILLLNKLKEVNDRAYKLLDAIKSITYDIEEQFNVVVTNE